MIEEAVRNGELAGAVTGVSDSASVIEIEVVGLADVDADRPMTADTMFWAASMTKPITATLASMLADDGLLDLDAPVAEYLPDFRPPILRVDGEQRVRSGPPDSPMTVGQALSHTSGLGFSSPIETPVLDAHPISTQVDAYAQIPLHAQPGSRWEYSNAGFNVVALVGEVVTGTPFA